MTFQTLTLEDWRNIATIIAAFIALVVYSSNSAQTRRQRRVENFTRLIEAHRQLFQNNFFKKHWREIELGTFRRDTQNEEANQQFSQLLGAIEHYAIFQRANIISPKLNTYMFGWWAQRIQPMLTTQERNNIYWRVAVEFLDEMKKAGDDFDKKVVDDVEKYFNDDFFG
jgi:type II secretory pathway component PulJ